MGGVTAVVVTRGGDDDGATAEGAATALAAVESRDLVVADTYEGQLGYGDARDHVTDRAGVVTTVAASGSTVEPGGALFSVDFEPTVVLRGAVPAYRALDVDATDGPDVAQLEQGLVDLGHGSGVTVDEHFDAGTAAAVKRWEDALGRATPDGRVELGDIAFAGGAVRVGTISADVGARVQEGSTVLQATPTEHVVTVDLDANRSNELEPGTKVGLTMPDDTETTGTVATIGSEAEAPADEGGGGLAPGGGGGPTVPVTITLDDPAAAASFDTGSVDVAIERSRDDDATAVPVTALLALAEGGYAVQLPSAGDQPGRLVAVDIGTYADGWVGVTGEGIEPGVEVVVPA
ncbi:MAG TPA: peptidoglycan-binding protein [Acidimicrobiales bacterium]|nr:peptidoglycan-binding protein [Acidimicrobiales bacterium]